MADYTGYDLGSLVELVSQCGDGGASIVWTNMVWDTVEDGYVSWTTSPDPDSTGSSYPGPGTWGVHTSGYKTRKRYDI